VLKIQLNDAITQSSSPITTTLETRNRVMETSQKYMIHRSIASVATESNPPKGYTRYSIWKLSDDSPSSRLPIAMIRDKQYPLERVLPAEASSPSHPPPGPSFLLPPDDARTATSGARAGPRLQSLRPNTGDASDGGTGRVGVRCGPPALRLLRVHMLEVCPPCAALPLCLRRYGTGWETEEGEAPWNRTNEHEATEWRE
jgi:hypothetical protein